MTEFKEGDPVRYFPGFRTGRSALGRIRYGKTYTVGGTEGYYVTGIGFMALSHLEPLEVPRPGVIKVQTVAEALTVCDWEGVVDVVITDQMERVKLQKLTKGLWG